MWNITMKDKNNFMVNLFTSTITRSLTEIANIVESNNTKILSSYVTSTPESTKMELTLKLNTSDIVSIVKDLERFDYLITASYKEDESDVDFLERYEQLMRFLNP